MRKLEPEERAQLVTYIATREGTAKEIARWFDTTVSELKRFVETNYEEIAEAKKASEAYTVDTPSDVVSPTQLDELWITNKFERLKRYQILAEVLYDDAASGKLSGADLSTCVREFRSYAALAANELGQLLHRGSGEAGTGDTMNVHFEGVDTEQLK